MTLFGPRADNTNSGPMAIGRQGIFDDISRTAGPSHSLSVGPGHVIARQFVLLIGAIGCAISFILAPPTPCLGSIESAARQYFGSIASAERLVEDDAGMVALRQQASLVLIQLPLRIDVRR